MTDLRFSEEELDTLIANLDIVVINQNIQAIERLKLSELREELLEQIAVDFGGVVDPIGQLQSWIGGVISDFSNWIVSQISGLINSFQSTIRSLINSSTSQILSTIQSVVITPITSLIDEATRFLTQTLPDTINSVIKGFQDTVTSALSAISDVISQITTSLQGIPGTIQDVVSTIVSQIQNALANISPTIENMVNSIVSSIGKIPGELSEMLNNISKGVQEVYSQIVKGVEDLSSSLMENMQSIIDSLGKSLEGIQTQIQSAFQDIQKRITDALNTIVEAIQGLPTQITNIVSQIQSAFADAISRVQEGIATLPEAINSVIGNIQEQLSSFWATIQEGINTFIKGLQDTLSQLGAQLSSFMESLKNLPQLIMEGITDLQAWIWQQLPDWVKNFLEEAPKALSQVGVTIQGFVNSILNFPNWFPQWFKEKIAEPIANAITTFFKPVSDFVSWVKDTVYSDLKKLWDTISGLPEKFPEWLELLVGKKIADAITEQGVGPFIDEVLRPFFEEKLIPFMDSLTVPENIPKLLENIWSALSSFFKDVLVPAIGGTVEALQSAISNVMKTLVDIGKKLIESIVGVGRNVASYVIDTFLEQSWKIGGVTTKLAQTFMIAPVMAITQSLRKTLSEALKGVYNPKEGELQFFITTNLGIITAMTAFRILGGLITSMARTIPLDIVIDLGIIGRPDISFRFNASWFISEIGKALFREPVKILNWLVMQQVFWFARTYSRPLIAIFRDWLPEYIPPLPIIVEYMRRMLPTSDFQIFRDMSRTMLYLQGMPTPVADLLTTTVDEKIRYIQDYGEMPFTTYGETQAYITYKDRFDVIRKLPLSLLYRVPEEQTLALFMVRDIFSTVDDFIKVMAARGVYEDTAFMYYLARFRYPSPEKLYEFWSRAQAGLLWYTPPGEMQDRAQQEAIRLGIPWKPIPPSELNIDTPAKSQLILSAITTYMKWHDYAIFSWFRGFTSDAWLWLDLMADIPTRIDARWMYKWAVFSSVMGVKDEVGLAKIIIARKIHPSFVPAVTVAEAMNALTEERTFFRTGILNAFNRGILDIGNVVKIFSGLFTLPFTVLVYNPGKKMYEEMNITVPVRFLEGESKLMILRALYDRSLRFFREIQRTLFLLISQGYDAPSKYPEKLKEVVSDINKLSTKIAEEYNLESGFKIVFDETYTPLFEFSAKLRQTYNILMRLRRWLWYSLYQLWYRFQRGMVSDEELDKFVSDLVDRLKLSTQEKEFFKDIALFFRDIYKREYIAKAVIKRYQKALISFDKALEELMKLGMDKETATARLEAEARVYTPTVSTLATLSEVVPEAIKLMDRVMDAQGIPPEEREIWKKYVIVKPLKDEAARLVTELITDYARGVISRAEFLRYLGELKPFGYTDEEIQMLVKLAELRRRRYAR